MPIAQYLLLLAITTIAGGLSAFMWFVPNGLMAAAMALCYSLGTIWLTEKQRRHPGSVGLPDAIVAGLISGMVASIPVLLLETLRPPRVNWMWEYFESPELNCWYLIAGPVLFGVALHYSYHRRKNAAKPFKRVLWTAFAFCAAIKLFLVAVDGLASASVGFGPGSFSAGDVVGLLVAIPIGFLWFVAPFPFLWIWATSSLDPAWELETKQNTDAEWAGELTRN